MLARRLFILPKAVSAWTPLQATGLLAWWDVSDSAARTIVNTNEIKTLTDKSGNGRTMTDISDVNGYRPVYYSSGNYMASPGTNDGLIYSTTQLWAGKTSAYAAFVLNHPATCQNTTFECFFLNYSGNSNAFPYSGNNNCYFDMFGNVTRAQALTTDYPASTPVQYGIAGTSSGQLFWRDGISKTVVGGTAFVVPAANWQVLGAHYQVNTRISEMICLDATPSLSDRQKIEGYLAYKWGIQSRLDSSHPYKSAPP